MGVDTVMFMSVLATASICVMAAVTAALYVKYVGLRRLFGGLTVLLIGKDRVVRVLKPKVKSAQFLDLGEYGKVALDPQAVYTWQKGLPGRVVFVYAPNAFTLPAEIGAFATKAKDDGVLDINDAKERDYGAEVKGPSVIRWQDVVSFMLYNINPIQIDLMIKRYIREVYGHKKLPAWLVVLVAGFALMVVVIAVAWKMGWVR